MIVTTSEGPRTIVLQPIEGQPRAWRLIGTDVQFREPFDGRLRFTLIGKSPETPLGVSGAGINLR